MTNGRVKGCRGEREVAKILQEWWRALEPECLMVRTPKSGGWSSSGVRANLRACGDIMSTSRVFPFTTEVKRNEAWVPERFMAGKKSPAWAWWRQAVSQAKEEGCIPVLWLRKNQTGGKTPVWLIVFPEEYLVKVLVPDVTWSKKTLLANNVNFADIVPAGCFSGKLLNVDPAKFLL